MFEPDGFRDRLVAALQEGGFSLTDTEISQNGSEPMKVTIASGKAFSLYFDRVYRYVIITEDFKKARDFDVLGLCAQKLIESEELTEDARARSGFSTVVALLMAHVPEQVRAACCEEAVVEGPAYVPVACDLSTGKAYCLTGKSFALMEFRSAQKNDQKIYRKTSEITSGYRQSPL